MAPVFSPASGTYSAAQSVTLSSATSGTTIYYTTDGSTPTKASTQYRPVAGSVKRAKSP
ncbi:MAG: chitobiase/beta-hexosaminidase C-terminal domain-containing protein [Fibrobacteres bacterium]|nr:chitobiase/beta-hexosaminidase C-terminal domain-containing protein [Fibrobacterota bacterium]